ncbi:hypothetical protein [Gimesia panareensis]|uniref:hypothetical protein n=1 Tax=Gimesia panareensis TaxID=2527978 RepID=UPI00118B1937|nr:hypothetical protein [Gimesia panareensis]QDU50174.1 hypothetical protein Pan110_25170 [Gimesia panareensis]
MINYEYLHELEAVELSSVTKRSVNELLPVFVSLGFTLHDDIVSLDRKDTVPPWQHTSVVEVEVCCGEEEVFGFKKGEWDTLCMKYLFASLPFEFTDRFIEVVFQLSEELGTSVKYQGAGVNAKELTRLFTDIRDELVSETGEIAGSEGLAILIHSTYPRTLRNR